LLIDRSDAEGIAEGDIVLFGRDRRFFVHRVVKKNLGGSQILTRGDAMPHPDPSFAERDLLGKVSLILRNDKFVVPRSRLNLPERIISALVQRSVVAARAIVALRELLLDPGQAHLSDASLSPN